jgi:hypothetical protein
VRGASVQLRDSLASPPLGIALKYWSAPGDVADLMVSAATARACQLHAELQVAQHCRAAG